MDYRKFAPLLAALASVALVGCGTGVCVTLESPPLGTQYGPPAHAPGDLVLTENGITVTLRDFVWPNGGTFGTAEIQASTTDFGTDRQIVWTNNINLEFGFGQLGFTPARVTFDFEDFGGFENFAVNGSPSPVFVGEITTAPSISTSPAVTIPGGYKSTGTVSGPVERVLVGGQEFGLDQVCAWES